jgi:hypothetical protein
MSVSVKSFCWSCGIEGASWLALKLPGVGSIIFTLLHLPAIALLSHVPKMVEEFWIIVSLQMLIWFVIWFVPLKIQERVICRKGHRDA